MIAQVQGTVVQAGMNDIVLMVGGIGWRIHVTPVHAGEMAQGSEATVYTSMVVREDSMTLYGFRSDDERDIFERLTSVSGIGSRIALAALSVLTPDDLRRAVSDQDTKTLCLIPGVGKKVAQRMALELQGKLGLPAALPDQSAPVASGAAEEEVRAALLQLGWNEAAADRALAEVGGHGLGTSDLLRAALVNLGGSGGR